MTPSLPMLKDGSGGRKGGSAVSEVEETRRMEQHRRIRRRLLKGFSGLASTSLLLVVPATATSCRFANDRDLPEKKLDSPRLPNQNGSAN